jgi:hypothetical protein
MSTFPDDGRPAPGGRRAMSNGMCIALIVAGAVLRFALTARSPHGLNVHIVGVILILAGVLGLILPFLTRLPQNRARRPSPPGRQPIPAQTTPSTDRSFYDDRPVLIHENRHLVRPAQPDRHPGFENQAQPWNPPAVPPEGS